MAVLPSRARHFATTILVLSLILRSGAIGCPRGPDPALPAHDCPRCFRSGAGDRHRRGARARACGPCGGSPSPQGDRRIVFLLPRRMRSSEDCGSGSLWSQVSAKRSPTAACSTCCSSLCTHSPWAAALLSAAWFAAGHAVQSARSMAIIFLFSLVFQGLALWTGALYVAMLAHFLYDVIAGLSVLAPRPARWATSRPARWARPPRRKPAGG